MGTESKYLLSNLLLKSLEISVLLLYVLDLVPKILIWRKPLLWKLLNVFVVTLMVVQMPITFKGYLESGISLERLKVRVFSIGLSFLLLCEILSIRE
jgi:hypothetical protein